MAETCEIVQTGQQEGWGEEASSSLLQPAGSQEIEQIESGTFVEDKIQTLELDEGKMDIKERQLGQNEKIFDFFI